MNEKFQVWRDEKKSLGEYEPNEKIYDGECNWSSSDSIHYGQLLSGYDYKSPVVACESAVPSAGKDFLSQFFVVNIKGYFNGENFTEKSLGAGNRELVCYFGDLSQCRADNPLSDYQADELEKDLAKDLLQHIDDEVSIANDLSDSNSLDNVYQTENFALRHQPELGNLMGVRVRAETKTLKSDGTFYKNLNENDWIWFTWDNATRGNSYKPYISTIAESKHADDDLVFIPSINGGEFGIMYVHTREDKLNDLSDWKELNISTMPKDDM